MKTLLTKSIVKKCSMIVACSLLLTACKDPMKYVYKEIKRAGYIAFRTPLEFSGPGTLIGAVKNDSRKVSLVAAPDTCFPKEIDGIPTDLVRIDKTTLPKRKWRVTASGGAKFGLAEFLKFGTPLLNAGAKFSTVHTMSLEMEGVHIEYMDSIKLTNFYKNQMSEICKEYLDKFGFIIQAIKVDKMEARFYSKSGAAIELDVGKIKQILDIGADVSFSIENDTSLVIDSPKYIGYQLGKLRRKDNGYALERASRTRFNKYRFESIVLFNDGKELPVGQVMQAEPGEWEFKDLGPSHYIK